METDQIKKFKISPKIKSTELKQDIIKTRITKQTFPPIQAKPTYIHINAKTVVRSLLTNKIRG